VKNFRGISTLSHRWLSAGVRSISALWPPIVVFLFVVAAMEIIFRVLRAREIVPEFLMPFPSEVAATLVAHRADLLVSLWTTAQAALIGFAGSAIFGILAAIVLSTSPLIRRAFYPYTVFFQTVPIVAIAPLLVIWFDPGLTSVAISAFIVSVFPVIANTLSGILSTEPALEDLFTLYGAGRLARLWKLRLPSALPSIITGLRVAAGLAVIGTVVGEFLVGMMGSGEGLGVRIVSAKKFGQTDLVFAAVIVASVLGLLMFGAVNIAGRILLRRWEAVEKS
jgi:NitT/TauT family transport system permease protein